MAAYKIGDRDERPWGSYEVTSVGRTESGEEYCEKLITVNPGQVLSLQSHDHRRESWKVEQGSLTVILDGWQIEMQPGNSLLIPLGSTHCMANLGSAPCLVRERQEGTCREEDIKRYLDAYGRETADAAQPAARRSMSLYRELLADIGRQTAA
jgi:mannose-6-phosphate isomerase-like protein (cupin superfamily)